MKFCFVETGDIPGVRRFRYDRAEVDTNYD